MYGVWSLQEVHRRYHTDAERYFFCDQYSNHDNWRAHYEMTAVEILEQTGGELTHVVVGVGTGGTVTGVGRRLKEHDPRIRLVCVLAETFPGALGWSVPASSSGNRRAPRHLLQ